MLLSSSSDIRVGITRSVWGTSLDRWSPSLSILLGEGHLQIAVRVVSGSSIAYDAADMQIELITLLDDNFDRSR